MPCDLWFSFADIDRSCPPRTSDFRCRADRARSKRRGRPVLGHLLMGWTAAGYLGRRGGRRMTVAMSPATLRKVRRQKSAPDRMNWLSERLPSPLTVRIDVQNAGRSGGGPVFPRTEDVTSDVRNRSWSQWVVASSPH